MTTELLELQKLVRAHEAELTRAIQLVADLRVKIDEQTVQIEMLRSMLERCVGATVTLLEPEKTADVPPLEPYERSKEFDHILSGDYYMPGRKDDV